MQLANNRPMADLWVTPTVVTELSRAGQDMISSILETSR